MNNELRTISYESRATSHERRAFTLIELVVAIGLLSIVLVFSGVIFKESIGSFRTASAQAEIMRKLRVITEQLNSDFKGLRKDAPVFILFQKPLNISDANRFDQIMFFADGDFQSTLLYNNSPLVSNIARIQYCHARIYSLSINDFADPTQQRFSNNSDRFLNVNRRTLARRQHLLTADPAMPVWPDISNFLGSFLPSDNNDFEHDLISLSQWQAVANVISNNDKIIDTCFSTVTPFNSILRPSIDFRNGLGLHILMTEGVSSFSVQWSYLYTDLSGQGHIFWWPSIDPDGNGDTTDSDFVRMGLDYFGVYFNAAPPSVPPYSNWFPYSGAIYQNNSVAEPDFPRALKFTFTLYDSKGVFKNGQTFTHIVYIGD